MRPDRGETEAMPGKKVIPARSTGVFLFLIIIFTLFIVLGVRARRHIVTGGIAGHICLECMGFK